MLILMIVLACLVAFGCEGSHSQEPYRPPPTVRVIGCSPETFFEHGHITVLFPDGQTRTLDTQDSRGPSCDSWKASELWQIEGADFDGDLVLRAKAVSASSLSPEATKKK